ncbi:hypothetical protein [Rickettsiella endosymbiont of Miltochrista miniata]|uniref:hypothetical protein n=1 Tax=Rickettsiella endosymbiont of Miltochrista miniata TaxID=3066239 RepID=UPI00313EEA5E
MPVKPLNNEKTEAVKKSLGVLLNQLKEQRRIATDLQPYMFNGDGLGPYANIGNLEALKKGIIALINLNYDFESVEDFDSVKKLKEIELFFLKNEGLKEFKFPDYNSQINPTLLTYADIEIQLDVLFEKSEDLLRRNCNLAAWEAKYLISDFRNLNRWYFEEKKITPDEYQSRALQIIDETRPVLEQHRGFKEILINLIILIATLGTAFIVNKVVNGHFLFFQKTDSAKQLDVISQTLAAANQLST